MPPHPQTGIRNATCHSFPESILRSLASGLAVSALTGEEGKKHGSERETGAEQDASRRASLGRGAARAAPKPRSPSLNSLPLSSGQHSTYEQSPSFSKTQQLIHSPWRQIITALRRKPTLLLFPSGFPALPAAYAKGCPIA